MLAPMLFADIDADLARAGNSPYDLARFVDSHATFSWGALWKALELSPELVSLPPCGRCSQELLTVLDPFQAIVILRHDPSQFEVFLRYVRPSGADEAGPWRFAGAYQPLVKYFEPRHRVVRIGRKPFLVVTGQGASGTGLSSEVDEWLDLTLPVMKLALSVVTRGTFSELARRFGLETSAKVAGIDEEPSERIRIAYTARLIRDGKLIAMRDDEAVYTRRGEEFTFNARLSRTPQDEIEDLYGIEIDDVTDERLRRLLCIGGRVIRPESC